MADIPDLSNMSKEDLTAYTARQRELEKGGAEEPTPIGGLGGPTVLPEVGFVIPVSGPRMGQKIPIREATKALGEFKQSIAPKSIFTPKPLILTARDAYELRLKNPKEQFKTLQKLEAIDPEATFVPPDDSGQWHYIPKAELEHQQGITSAQQIHWQQLSGLGRFSEFVAKGLIPSGSIYAGIDDEGNPKYYKPGTVKVVGKGEVLSIEDYKNIPLEWKTIVDKEGTSGLKKKAYEGELPLPKELNQSWFYRDKEISYAERNNIIDEWTKEYNRVSEALSRDPLNLGLAEAKFRLGPNPATEIVRDPSQVVETVERALNTFNQNVQSKVTRFAETLPDIKPPPEGALDAEGIPLTDWNLVLGPRGGEKLVRGYAALGLTTIEALTIRPHLSLAKAVTHPKDIPGMAAAMVAAVPSAAVTYWESLKPDSKVSIETAGQSLAILGLAVYATRGVVSKVFTYLYPRGVPSELIGIESTTGRTPIIKDIDVEALRHAHAQANIKAMTPGLTRTSGEIPVEGTNYAIRYVTTPWQRIVGDTVWHGSTDMSFLEKGSLKVGEGYLYTNSWAAMGFTRTGGVQGAPGAQAGLLMIITDPSKVREIPMHTMYQQQPGIVGPFKTYQMKFETELVYANGSSINLLPPTADLATRLLVGKNSDFFTYYDGRFMPIRIGIDKGILDSGSIPHIPSILDLYAVKLQTIQNTIQHVGEALKHPGRTIQDIAQATFYGRSGPIGVRDVELVSKWGGALQDTSLELFDEAIGVANQEAAARGILSGTPQFRALFDNSLRQAYDIRVQHLLSNEPEVAKAYNTNEEVKRAFEDAYRTNLQNSGSALIQSAAITEDINREVRQDYRDNVVRSTISEVSKLPRASDRINERTIDSRRLESPRLSTVSSPRLPETRESLSDTRVTTPDSRIAPDVRTITPSSRVAPEERRQPPAPTIIEPPTIETPPTEERPPTEETPPTQETPPTIETPPTEEYPPTIEVPPTILTKDFKLPHKKEQKDYPLGTAIWKMGWAWKVIPPPYDLLKPITERTAPKGVEVLEGTPQETLTFIGGVIPFKNVAFDLGVVDGFIDVDNKTIVFTGKGQQTKVGERMPNTPTKGISLKDSPSPILPFSRQQVEQEQKQTLYPSQAKSRPREVVPQVSTGMWVF